MASSYGATDETEAQQQQQQSTQKAEDFLYSTHRYRSALCDGAEEDPEDDECCEACSVPAQFLAEVYEHRTALLHVWAILVAVLICLIGLYAKFYEEWSFLWSLYFSSYVSMGVGYGDLRIHETTMSWLSLSAIELSAVLVVGSVLSVAISAIYLTDVEEDWVTVKGAHKRFRKCFMCILFLAPLAIGAIALAERWTFSKALYWFVDTITTVGCGYATPTSRIGRVLTIVALIMVSPLFLTIFSTIVLYPRATLRNTVKIKTLELYRRTHPPRPPDDSKDAFILKFLCQSKLIEEADLADATSLYESLYGRRGGRDSTTQPDLSSERHKIT